MRRAERGWRDSKGRRRQMWQMWQPDNLQAAGDHGQGWWGKTDRAERATSSMRLPVRRAVGSEDLGQSAGNTKAGGSRGGIGGQASGIEEEGLVVEGGGGAGNGEGKSELGKTTH